MLGISLTLFKIGYFGAVHREGQKDLPLPKICHIYPKMIKLGTVIPYLKKIQKTNGQKRYQQSTSFVVIRNSLMSDLKNDIFKMTFSKFKCSQIYFETSLFTRQTIFIII